MSQCCLKQSGASYVEQKTLRGIIGTGTVVHRYLAAVYIGGVKLLGVRIAGHPEVHEAVIGRDVLNQLMIILDGPAETLEIR